MDKREYFHFDNTNPVSIDELKDGGTEFQVEVMRDWFTSKYEDPAQHTPYESKEGGYIYIWGGPYDAREEIEEEFAGIVSEDAIDELVSELEALSHEWTGKPSSDSYDDYFYDVISANTEFHGTLTENLNNIRKLFNNDIPDELSNLLNMMLFVNVITALETFLSDAFIGTVIGNEQLMKKFVSSNSDFSARKFTLNEIFDRMDHLEKEVRNYLLDLIWHNLPKIRTIYENTFELDFPSDIKNIYQAIAKRHDIVHRSGKTKDCKPVKVSRDEIEKLMWDVRSFADHIDSMFGV